MSDLDSISTAEQSKSDHNGAVVHVAGQELTFFVHSTSLIAAMIKDIAAATNRVWLESYIFADDAAGRAVAEALIERAGAGVDVRVVYDGFGSIRTPTAFFEKLCRAGIQVHAYHAFWQTFKRLAFLRVFNRRDHRKLLMIDDRIAYFGGMNIVDQREIYATEDGRARKLPSSGAWRDVHIRLQGLRQAQIAVVFDRLWKRVHHQTTDRTSLWPVKTMLRSQGDDMFFFDCRPSLRRRRPQRVFAPLIRKARRQITISMAYFIPQGAVLRELVRARQRGVKIRIIVPGKSDVPAVQSATRYFYAYLLRRGFRIYEQSDNMLHGKALAIDDEWSIVGSCNLDPRSLFYNLEFVAVFHSPQVAAVIESICQFEIANSRRITKDDVADRPWRQRVVDYVAWWFRRWL